MLLLDPLILVRQRLQQRTPDDAEDRRVCANTEGERQHHNCRETRRFKNNTPRVANIVPHAPSLNRLAVIAHHVLRDRVADAATGIKNNRGPAVEYRGAFDAPLSR